MDVTAGSQSVSRTIVVEVFEEESNGIGGSGTEAMPETRSFDPVEMAIARLESLRVLGARVLEDLEVGEQVVSRIPIYAGATATLSEERAQTPALMQTADRPEDLEKVRRVAEEAVEPVDSPTRTTEETAAVHITKEPVEPEALEKRSMWVKDWASFLTFFFSGSMAEKKSRD